MLLAFALSFILLVDSIRTCHATDVDAPMKLGERITLTAKFASEFDICTLRNNFKEVVCEVVKESRDNQCSRKISYEVQFVKGNACIFTLEGLQQKGNQSQFFCSFCACQECFASSC